jgi:hypothetical protein
MRRMLTFALVMGLLLWLAIGPLHSALADPNQAVPPGCESGRWVLTDAYVGTPEHHWIDPLYPSSSRENQYGRGWFYDPCYPVGSWANGYGSGYNGVATP